MGEHQRPRSKEKQGAARDRKRREEQKNEALNELYKHQPASAKEAPSSVPVAPARQRRVSRLEQIHAENQAQQEARQQAMAEIAARKQEKLRKRQEWTRKFNLRTRKGQIPLDHRINFTFRKIKALKANQFEPRRPVN